MKVCVILICMVIGSACVDLQRIANGEDDLKSNTNMATKVASRAASPTSVETIIEDQHNLSRGVYADDASSKEETEASEKPTPVLTQTTVATEVKNSRRQRGYLGTRAVDRLWSLLKRSHRLISAKLMESHPRTSATIRDTDSDIKRKIKGSLRRKKRYTKRIEMDDTNRNGFPQMGRITYIFSAFRSKLTAENEKTIALDKALIKSLIDTGTVTDSLLNEYKAAKTEERKKVKEEVERQRAAGDNPSFLINGYNMLNEDAAYGYEWDDYQIRREDDLRKEFLDTPSPALDKFTAMKRKEEETFMPFLEGELTPDIYEGPQVNEFQEGTIEIRKTAEFESSKKRREIDSVASVTRAQLFLIILCLVIGVAIVDLHWLEVSEDGTEVNEKARKVKRTLPKTDRIGSAAERRIDRNSQFQTTDSNNCLTREN